MTRSIADWQATGFLFESDEAVAIAQELITSLLQPRHPDEARPPYGPPSPDNVFLKPDGSVVCRGCLATPAVSEVAIFLEQLLPVGSPRVPGALRYTIARALLNVDVRPFDSLEELSRDLSRHERGHRTEVIRRALARANRQHAIVAVPLERRRNGGRVTTLRRELREADVRLYQQGSGRFQEPLIIDLVASAPGPYRARRLSAAAACVAVGCSLIGAGQLMHRQPTPAAAMIVTPAAVRTAVSDELRRPPEPPIVTPEPVRESGIIAVQNVRPPIRSSRPVAHRISVKRTARQPVVTVQRQPAPRRSSRGVMDRLRLGWLKHAFTSLAEL